MAAVSDATDVQVRPVTGATWADFARPFEGRGGPHDGWCKVIAFAGRGR